jgi:hypothetical protein
MKQPANRQKLAANIGLLFAITALAFDFMANIAQAFASDCIGTCLPPPNMALPFGLGLVGLLISAAALVISLPQRGSAKVIAFIGIVVSGVSIFLAL